MKPAFNLGTSIFWALCHSPPKRKRRGHFSLRTPRYWPERQAGCRGEWSPLDNFYETKWRQKDVMELTQAQPNAVWEFALLIPSHRNELSFGGRGNQDVHNWKLKNAEGRSMSPQGLPHNWMYCSWDSCQAWCLSQAPSRLRFCNTRGWSKGQKKKPCKRQLTDYFTSEIS